jgi:hypothetical protein
MTESRLPPLAVIIGIAGLVPFFLSALVAVRADPVSEHFGTMALITYGAVILSFLGAVHWGFVIEGAREPAESLRLALGVLPALVGWGAILLGLIAQPALALGVLIAGFAGTVVVEQRARHRELIPRAYIILRWGLTVVVVGLLATVLCVRILGVRLTF